jgi:hypothetical protein
MPTFTVDTFNFPDSEQEFQVIGIVQVNSGAFVAGGAMVGATAATHEALTSPDGEVWTAREGASEFINGIAYSPSLDRIVMVGSGNAQYSDDDGATWSAGNGAVLAGNTWQSVAWSPTLTLFAACASDSSGDVLMTSGDGITWTVRTPSHYNAWRVVEWSTIFSKFMVAGGDSGVTDNLMYSTDGTTWTAGTTPSGWKINNGREHDVYAEITSLGMGAWSSQFVITSTNGTTWSAITDTTDPTWSGSTWFIKAINVGGVDYFMNIGATAGTTDTGIQYSDDGITWTAGQVQGAAGDWCPHIFVSGSTALYLTDQDGSQEPDDTLYVWSLLVDGTSTTFWYKSDVPGLESGVDATAVSGASARPRPPRGAVHTTPFDADNPLLGFPGHAIAHSNRMIYATSDYTVATDLPPLRVWNGTSDYQLAVVPKDGSGNIPNCIVSMVNGDGKIYLATWDTGTTNSNIAGRVLRLDPNSGQLTNVGNVNTLAGYLPWALKFHNGELWVGAHRSDTSAGRIYRIKPEEQTTWTLDRDLTTDSVGACTLIDSYKGKMYFGSSAASGTFAKWGSRDTTGTYALLYTGTGGTAQDYNGFYASCVFGDNIYFSYWNPDATEISLIKKYDGSSVTTAKDVAAVAAVPIIALFVHDGVLYALGSRLEGTTWTSVLLTTTDGTTWTNRTGDLPLGSFTSRGLANAFATIAY